MGPGGALCLLPDPVQPFEDSVYKQTQIFRAAPEASVCVLDWVTQGRSARGEDWSFVEWSGRNEVWLDHSPGEATRKDRLLVRDSVILSSPDSMVLGRSLKESMHRLGVFGTLILRGPLMLDLGQFFLSEFESMPRLGERDFRSPEAKAAEDGKLSPEEQWRQRRVAMENSSGLQWSAARVRGCVVVKFGATTVEAGRDWIGGMLDKEGSLESHFGRDALMCVR